MMASVFIAVLCLLLLAIGWLLAVLAGSRRDEEGDLTQRVEQVLPGTQCGQCGYPGCAAYAQAMCSGQTTITRCVPGGPDTVQALAALLNVDPGEETDNGDEQIFRPRRVAFIHKDPCTGCTKCVRVCPMDCIMGKPRYVHEVIPEECIGCEECVRVCPEKCIEMVGMEPSLRHFNWDIKSIRITGSPKST